MGDADNGGNFAGGADRRQAAQRNGSDNLPGVQCNTEEQGGPVPVGDVSARWGRLALLAL